MRLLIFHYTFWLPFQSLFEREKHEGLFSNVAANVLSPMLHILSFPPCIKTMLFKNIQEVLVKKAHKNFSTKSRSLAYIRQLFGFLAFLERGIKLSGNKTSFLIYAECPTQQKILIKKNSHEF